MFSVRKGFRPCAKSLKDVFYTESTNHLANFRLSPAARSLKRERKRTRTNLETVRFFCSVRNEVDEKENSIKTQAIKAPIDIEESDDLDIDLELYKDSKLNACETEPITEDEIAFLIKQEQENPLDVLHLSLNSELISILDLSRKRDTQIEYEKLEHVRKLAAMRVNSRAVFDTESGENATYAKNKSDFHFHEDPVYQFIKDEIESRAKAKNITFARRYSKLPVDAVAMAFAFEFQRFMKKAILDSDGIEPMEFRALADKIRSTMLANMNYSDQKLWQTLVHRSKEDHSDVEITEVLLKELIDNTFIEVYADNDDPFDLQDEDEPLGELYAFDYDHGNADMESDFDPNSVKLEMNIPRANPHEFVDTEILTEFDPSVKNENLPAMCCPPTPWTNAYDGGFMIERHKIIRYHEEQRSHMQAIMRADMQPVYEGLNALGCLPWKINVKIYDVIQEIRQKNYGIAGIVKSHIPIAPRPTKPKYDASDASSKLEYRRWAIEVTRLEREYQTQRSKRDDTSLKMSCATDALQHDEIYFPYSLDFRGRTYPLPPHLNHLGNDLSRGILSFGRGKPVGKRGLYWMKVHLANQFGFDKASFDDRVAWIEERLDMVFDCAESPIDPVNPTEPKWWATADCPWQALATIFDLAAALKSDNPEEYVSHLTVHQDGSCNGLQHYAALGRDRSGGEKVNLVDSDKPGDVYTAVAKLVQKTVDEHVADYDETNYEKEIKPLLEQLEGSTTVTPQMREKLQPYLASILQDKITRKVVKQTTMTSVYGVTFIGARDQIMNRLEEINEKSKEQAERGQEHPIIIDPFLLTHCANYLARITQRAIGDTFKSAEEIMDWLKDCSAIITSLEESVSWLTPLGFPVIQPYRRNAGSKSTSVNGQVSKFDIYEDMPVSKNKQKSAFPPNFVHALDSSHMLLTAIECTREDINFAAVHDSYWAHACDIDRMNVILRDKFVELHGQNILEDLKYQFQSRYPMASSRFKDPPIIGDLDISLVKESTYFFN